MATEYAIDEIRKDHNMFHPFKLGLVNRWSEDTILEEVKKYSDEEYVVSEIVGRPVLSKRYVEKVLSVVHKYYRRPNDLNMLARSTVILYDDQKQGAEKFI